MSIMWSCLTECLQDGNHLFLDLCFMLIYILSFLLSIQVPLRRVVEIQRCSSYAFICRLNRPQGP